MMNTAKQRGLYALSVLLALLLLILLTSAKPAKGTQENISSELKLVKFTDNDVDYMAVVSETGVEVINLTEDSLNMLNLRLLTYKSELDADADFGH